MAVSLAVVSIIFSLLVFAAAYAAGEDTDAVQERQAKVLEQVTLQVFVIADGDLTFRFNRLHDLMIYVVTFLNAVNLILKQLTEPRVQLELVMLQETRNAFQGKWQKEVFVPKAGDVDAASTLINLVKYTTPKLQYNSSDIILLMTSRNVYYTRTIAGRPDKMYNPPGWSYRGTVCKPDKVAIVKDDGVFYSGVRNAARQIARLLGAPLDGVENIAKECAWKSGYLMGQFSNGNNRFVLSSCSKKMIKKTLREAPRDCFNRKYRTSYQDETRDFPGDVVNEDKFCESSLPGTSTGTCNSYRHLLKGRGLPEQCGIVCCKWKGWKEFIGWEYTAFDGKRCSANKICILGKCEEEIKYRA